MCIARIAHLEGTYFVFVEGEDNGATLHEVKKHPFGQLNKTGRSWPLAGVHLLIPMLPSKVIAIGRNYTDHVAEVSKKSAGSLPPAMFIKPPTAVTGPGAPIRISNFTTNVEFRGELTLVIGKPCKDVEKEDAHNVIFECIIINDVSSRDLQLADGRWVHAKDIDTFCPLGPWIRTELDYNELPIKVHLTHEGITETKQDSNLNQMIMFIPRIIKFVAASITLLLDNVICTDSPAGIAAVFPGNCIEIEVPGIDKLINPVERA